MDRAVTESRQDQRTDGTGPAPRRPRFSNLRVGGRWVVFALAALALIDFDHAKTTTDRLQLPEARLYFYLQIAEHTIQQTKVNSSLFLQDRILE